MVSLDVRDRIAYATLDRPKAMNGIDEATLDGIGRVIDAVAADERVKALVVTGAGDAFCVGLDIELLGRAFEDLDYFGDVVRRLKDLLLGLEQLPVPVIASVNGLARAGGFEMILACDIAIVAEEARVGDTHLAFGVVPGGGATQRAPRKLGPQRARELIYTGRWLSGREAVEYGLALRSAPRVSLDDAVEDLVAQLRPLSRACLAATKAAMREGAGLPLEQALDVELQHFLRYLKDVPTSREGYRAYVEKRAPDWD